MNRSITDDEIFALWIISENKYPSSFFDTHMEIIDRYITNALYPVVRNSFTRQLYDGDMRLGYWVNPYIQENNRTFCFEQDLTDHMQHIDYTIHLTGILHHLPQSLQKMSEFSYYIEDPWCFVPTKKFIMMIYAKIWYRINKDQFE